MSTAILDAPDAPGADRGYVVMAADKWDHTSHGDIRMQVRDATDRFVFQTGKYGAERDVASIDAAGVVRASME